MRILFITPEIPYAPDTGAKIRIYSLLKNLASRNQVSLISFDREPENPSRITALKEICADVIAVPLSERGRLGNKRVRQLRSLVSRYPYQYFAYHSPEMQRTIDRFVSAHPVDVVDVEYSQMGYYTLPHHTRRVLSLHNVEHELLYRNFLKSRSPLRRIYNYVEWRKFRRQELEVCRKFSMCLTTSERDKRVIAADLPTTPLAVIPNGVDTRFFKPDAEESGDDHTIVFTGTIDYYPNIDGLTYFVEEVLPLVRQQIPGVRFFIVGKDPPPAIRRYGRDPGIVVTGTVDDVRGYFRKTTAVVVPLRIGGGTRLKILEAMAMGKPVVSTAVGAEGLEVADGENILIADDPPGMARALISVLRDRALRERLAGAGRKLVEERYDWTSIANRLERAYSSLLGG